MQGAHCTPVCGDGICDDGDDGSDTCTVRLEAVIETGERYCKSGMSPV